MEPTPRSSPSRPVVNRFTSPPTSRQNEADAIKAAFEPYYEATLLSEATDPNLLYEHQTRLAVFPVYTEADVDAFAQGLLRSKGEAGPSLRRAHAGGRALRGHLRGREARLSRPAHRLGAALRLPRPGAELRRRRPREALRLRPVPAPCYLPIALSCRVRYSRTSTWSPTASNRPASGKIALERRPGVLAPVSTKQGHDTTAEELETLSRCPASMPS